ncbi:MAG: transglutaminase domain-containing protein [Methanomicrobiales archaeon]
MLLILSVALISSNSIYANTDDLQPLENVSDSNTTENIESNNNSADNALSTNNSTNSTSNDSENIQEYAAAGEEVYDHVQGFWLNPADVNKINVDSLKTAGITDIFLLTKSSTTTYTSQLQTLINKLSGSGIRIHAWIICFKDSTGKWVDPSGKYSYQVKTPVKSTVKTAYKSYYKKWFKTPYKTAYKSYYKSWYKSGGRWRYVWKYTWKYKTYYKWNYQWTYKIKYKWVKKTTYKYVTKYGTSTAFNDALIKSISSITKNYDISGIHLDYVRYPGTAYKHANGVDHITSFVKRAYTTVKSVKSKVSVSAALMPEKSVNAYYYGQDYAKLAPYLDFLVPMVYKGNYNQNTNWIGSTVKYIADKSGGKPVIAGLQSYRSDSNVVPIPAAELDNDIEAATDNGASGFVMFRYGLIDKQFFSYDSAGSGDSYVADSTTINEIKAAATRVKAFIETNKRLPNYVTLSGRQIGMAEFLHLLVSSVVQINQGNKNPIKFREFGEAPNPTGNKVVANIYKKEYVTIAGKLKSFLESNKRAPNYGIYSAGKVNYKYLVYSYSKIMDFYKSKGRLPNYAVVNTKSTSITEIIPPELKPYLVATNNCQVNDAAIKSLALSITQGTSSNYEKADKIFRWVRDNISYTFYYNTKYGATGMLKTRDGNCIDHTHLMIAMARSVGIPARYAHAQCEFTSMTVGHVWAELYANGAWYTADATSSRNNLGVMQNCKLLYWKGRYAELPF